MNKRFFPWTLILLLLALAITLSGAAYAWLALGDTAKGMEYSIAKIDSSVIMYHAIDDNGNGVPNLLEESVPFSYYLEQYAFEQVGIETYALSEDLTANMLTALDLENVLPTQRYTFKYALTNRSAVRNLISFRLQGVEYADTALLSTLSFRLGAVESSGSDTVGLPRFGEKIYLLDYIEGNAFLDCALCAEEFYLDGMTGAQDDDNHLDFWLQIEMESYDALAQRGGFSLTHDQYNALQGTTVSLPALYIYFEIVI